MRLVLAAHPAEDLPGQVLMGRRAELGIGHHPGEDVLVLDVDRVQLQVAGQGMEFDFPETAECCTR